MIVEDELFVVLHIPVYGYPFPSKSEVNSEDSDEEPGEWSTFEWPIPTGAYEYLAFAKEIYEEVHCLFLEQPHTWTAWTTLVDVHPTHLELEMRMDLKPMGIHVTRMARLQNNLILDSDDGNHLLDIFSIQAGRKFEGKMELDGTYLAL